MQRLYTKGTLCIFTWSKLALQAPPTSNHVASCFGLCFSCLNVSHAFASYLSGSHNIDFTSGGVVASGCGCALARGRSTMGRTESPDHEGLETNIDQRDCMGDGKHCSNQHDDPM